MAAVRREVARPGRAAFIRTRTGTPLGPAGPWPALRRDLICVGASSGSASP